MLKRKKIAKIRREREAKRKAVADAEAQHILNKQLQERRKRLKRWKEEGKNVFWQEYHNSLRENEKVGQGNGPLKAAPCTKKRSVLDPY